MSAAVILTFTRELTLKGRPGALIESDAGDFARVPGKLGLPLRLTGMTPLFLTMLAAAVGQIAIQWPACSRREDRLADFLCDRTEPSPRHVSGAVLMVNTSQERRAGARDGISGAGARHVPFGDRKCG